MVNPSRIELAAMTTWVASFSPDNVVTLSSHDLSDKALSVPLNPPYTSTLSFIVNPVDSAGEYSPSFIQISSPEVAISKAVSMLSNAKSQLVPSPCVAFEST